MSKFCGSCGTALADGAAFCEGCGTAVGNVGASGSSPFSSPSPAAWPKTPDGLVARFWGFDRLIGSALVKIVYYVGMALIGLAVVTSVFGSLASIGDGSSLGFGVALMALVFGGAGLVGWRFVCELAVLAFQTYNRLGEIRDRLPPTAA